MIMPEVSIKIAFEMLEYILCGFRYVIQVGGNWEPAILLFFFLRARSDSR